MNEKRTKKFLRAATYTQKSLSVILENISDTHNIGAIMRTCDSIGVRDMYIINTENSGLKELITLGKRSSMGTRKWVNTHYFRSWSDLIAAVRVKHDIVLGTALLSGAKESYSLDLTGNMAIVLGNEKDGLSSEALNHCDGLVAIPQVGMAESLNVSVAAAIILYEAYRQRMLLGRYSDQPELTQSEINQLFNNFKEKGEDRNRDPKIYKILPH